ncbi:hypothetical protein DENSPDRAFT_866855 [Dentipellis sp. KUC8613]|nr:hypothetical protein DENSPDRAFT_866855 [Dentipellis sp. KUC8613]
MDKTTSVIAAFSAGKQPSQAQINNWIDFFLQSELIQIEQTSRGGELSENGRVVARDLRHILEAYKSFGSSKNKDNVLQEALWHLSQADLAAASLDVDVPMDKQAASNDYRSLVASLRTSLEILWTSATSEGSGVFSDFASFMRLSLADMAEAIGERAEKAAETLRAVEQEVQEGERDSVGRKRKSEQEEAEDRDPKVKFEKGMDTAKGAGSAVIGTAQSAKQKADELSARSSEKLREVVKNIAKHARENPEYHQALNTIFDLISKWIKATGDAAEETAKQSTSLESFIQDPTESKHLLNALGCMRKLAENLAGGKSLDSFFDALRTCVIDIRRDESLQSWMNDFLAYSKKNLEAVGLEDPETRKQEREDLKHRWAKLTDEKSSAGRKWKDDVAELRKELQDFERRVDADTQLQEIRKTHAKFGADLQEFLFSAASMGFQLGLEKASWMLQDFFNVYLPRMLGMIKDIPIPRTEYKDPEVEFVLEDLDISSLSLLPGHVFIRNITDVDISAPGHSPATTAVGSLTHVHAKGLQLQLKEVSFYYLDKTAAVGPSEYSGIFEVTLPPQGIDVEVKIRMIPNTPDGLKAREKQKGFHRIEQVSVSISDDMNFSLKQSNHSVLVSVFKPIMKTRLREALESVLREQIRGVLESADAIAWDVGSRAVVFEDAGLSRGPALTAAFWSELGHLQKMPGGLFGGWTATGTGLVKEVEGENAQFAMGAEPQIISGDKHGPKGRLAKPLAEQSGVDTGDVAKKVGDTAQQAKEGVKRGVQKVRSFKSMVEQKKAQEEARSGWSSPAFDVSSA